MTGFREEADLRKGMCTRGMWPGNPVDCKEHRLVVLDCVQPVGG